MKQPWLIGLLVAGIVLGVLAGVAMLRSAPALDSVAEDTYLEPVDSMDLWESPSEAQILSALDGLGFQEFVEISYERYLLRFPQSVTYYGLASQFDVRNDRLNDYSPEYLAETRSIESAILGRLQAFERNQLPEELLLTYDACEAFWSMKVNAHAYAERDYLVTNVRGSSPDWLLYDLLTSYHPQSTLEDIEDYMMRLSLIAFQFDQLIESLEDRAQRGIVAPRPVLSKARELLEGMAFGQIESHPLFFNLAMMVVANNGMSESLKRTIFASAAQLMNSSVLPAYRRLHAKVAELEQQAPETASLLLTPNGDSYYAYLVRTVGDTELSGSELHKWALRRTDEIQDEIRREAVAMGFNQNEEFAQMIKRIAADGGTQVNDSIPLAFAYQIAMAKSLSQPAFSTFPTESVNISLNPFIVAFYRPASIDGSREAELSVPRAGAQPAYLIPTQTYRETYPGLHVYVTSQRQPGHPLLRQTELFPAHALGWAAYAERLAWELGAYEDNPFGNLGRLVEELKRAVLVAVDTGIHLQDWTYEEALVFYFLNTGASEADAQMNVLQAIAHPGTQLSAFTGYHAILDHRDQALHALGNEFDLKEFHDAVLGSGSLPLSILERVVRDYIDEKLAG